MGFRGNFRQVSCQRLGGKMWSFELTNTNWIRKSTYNITIYDANRQQPWFWRWKESPSRSFINVGFRLAMNA